MVNYKNRPGRQSQLTKRDRDAILKQLADTEDAKDIDRFLYHVDGLLELVHKAPFDAEINIETASYKKLETISQLTLQLAVLFDPPPVDESNWEDRTHRQALTTLIRTMKEKYPENDIDVVYLTDLSKILRHIGSAIVDTDYLTGSVINSLQVLTTSKKDAELDWFIKGVLGAFAYSLRRPPRLSQTNNEFDVFYVVARAFDYPYMDALEKRLQEGWRAMKKEMPFLAQP